MRLIRVLFPVLLVAWSSASAETMKFEDAAAMLGTNCARDIDANCRGVNFEAGRLKDCLARNDDSLSAQCRGSYVRAFDAIQKRVAARSAVTKMCERDAAKFCADAQKVSSQVLSCLLAGPRGVSINCNKAISEAGYR